MIKTEICIIGGGASALMCASSIANKKDIVIIDKNVHIGKKILVTGNGRCNLTNMILDENKYNTKLVSPYFKKFSNFDTLNYFKKLGLETTFDNENRVYPLSNTANSVLDVLKLDLDNKNVKSICNETVKSLTNMGDYFEIILSNNEKIISTKVVLALGGNPNLDFLKNINLPIKKYSKSLGGLKTDENKGLNNIRVPNTKVSLITNNKVYSQIGEVQFKSDSISGIVIFNLSSILARKNDYKAKFSLDFLPNTSLDELITLLIQRKNTHHYKPAREFLTGMFHKALNINLLEKCKIDLNQNIENLSIHSINKLAELIKNYELSTYEMLDNNQVYSGGISLKVMDENLMCKHCNNLFIIGEMLDVDAECGGYNLQWAWTSGYIAGKAL